MTQDQVLIARGGGGIGYETAQAFARRRTNVVLTDVNADMLKQAVAHVPPLGVDCQLRTIDVGDEVAMQRQA